MDKAILHYGIHFLLPVLLGYTLYPSQRMRAILILLGGIIIDVDHLLADPVFDPSRCSIGFHPLHSYWAIAVYFLLLLNARTRIFGLALLIHILADFTDCYYPFHRN